MHGYMYDKVLLGSCGIYANEVIYSQFISILYSICAN